MLHCIVFYITSQTIQIQFYMEQQCISYSFPDVKVGTFYQALFSCLNIQTHQLSHADPTDVTFY